MNERYGRDYDEQDNGTRDERRSQRDNLSQRDDSFQRDYSRGESSSSRGERERGNWGSGRSWGQGSGEYGGGSYSSARSQSGQGARYGYPQYERGEPYSGEYGDSGYGAGGYTGSGAGRSYGGSSFGGHPGGSYRGQSGQLAGERGQGGYGSYGQDSQSSYGGYGQGSYGGYGQGSQSSHAQSGQYGQSSSSGREENWGTRWPSNDRWQRSGSYGTQRDGGFFGKGPKGYTRSDDRIKEDVCDRLSDDDELDASDITVTVKNGDVTLEGTAPDRRSKRRAEDIAEAVGGVREVHNLLRAQKGLLQEMGDRVTGRAEAEQHGHTGSGTRNSGASSSSSSTSTQTPSGRT